MSLQILPPTICGLTYVEELIMNECNNMKYFLTSRSNLHKLQSASFGLVLEVIELPSYN